jgi:hypothetical protein
MAVEPKRGCGYRKVGGIYLEKSALTKLRRSGQMQQLFELAQLKASLRYRLVGQRNREWGERRGQ